MNKKGISPLIVTVLLIGFAIALAAIVMTWGTSFIRETTEETEAGAGRTLLCATQLSYEIKGANCGQGKMTVNNNADIEITEFKLRMYDKQGNMMGDPEDLDGLLEFASNEYTGLSLNGVYKIDLIATAQGVTCGDAPRSKIINCGAGQ